jgi:anti-anti-sigma factor
MKLQSATIQDVPVVRVEGEIDMSNTHDIDVAVGEAVTNQAHALILDLSGVTYLDSAGVRLLYQLDARLAVHQQRLVLIIPPSATILRTLQAAGVIGSLVLASTQDVALLIALAPQDAAKGPNGTTG